MRIGVLTGGGDCPGLNAVIRAITRKGIDAHGHEFVGFRYGWAGVLNNDTVPLDLATTRGILHRGGPILGTAPTQFYDVEESAKQVKDASGTQSLDPPNPSGGRGTP